LTLSTTEYVFAACKGQITIESHTGGLGYQTQNGPQAQLSLRAARWTVWDWPRGGHSNVASTATPGFVFWTILTDLRQAESILIHR